jgi:hypothetical protein
MPLTEVLDYCKNSTTLLDQCDLSEETSRTTIEAKISTYTEECQDFQKRIREWARAVFAGQEHFDEAIEKVWQAEGWKLYRRVKSFTLELRDDQAVGTLIGVDLLTQAQEELRTILEHWVRPQLAVGPAARMGLRVSAEEASAIRERLASLAVPKTSS